jgi:hypothetical protein
MSDDCTYGISVVRDLLEPFQLQDKFCYVDYSGEYFGISRQKIEGIFDSADLFVDLGSHGMWLSEANRTQVRVLVDGEPGYRQIKMEKDLAAGVPTPEYDYYYSNGANLATGKCTAPKARLEWNWVYNPVVLDLFPTSEISAGSHFTTVMNWQAHEILEYQGKEYGQKDVEFEKFISLAGKTKCPMEIAVSGKNLPLERLQKEGWRIVDAHMATASIDSYFQYLAGSRGEFSVAKNVFVAMNTGWFSDRSAAYLACGKPVVLQDTGFGQHLPTGLGLFAVRTCEEARAAIEMVNADYERHSKAAREIAGEYLDSQRVLTRFLSEIGC